VGGSKYRQNRELSVINTKIWVIWFRDLLSIDSIDSTKTLTDSL